MSTSNEYKPLPLPKAPTPITDDSELLKIWDTIDEWYSKVKKATDDHTCNIEWHAYGCHILLGCKVIYERLQPVGKNQQAKNERFALSYTLGTLKRIQDVHHWVGAIAAVKGRFPLREEDDL